MTETTENPPFIKGPVAELFEQPLNTANPNYAPELDAAQMGESLLEREFIFAKTAHMVCPALDKVVYLKAVEEMEGVIRGINSREFFDTDEVSFIINPLKLNENTTVEKYSDSDVVDSIIDKMCVAMKAAGVNNQTIATVRSTTKINIENSLAGNDEVSPIPQIAPKAYRGVIQDGPPVEFIRSVYAKWVLAEMLDREKLDELDHNLVLAVYSYKKRNSEAPTLKDVLASKAAAAENRKRLCNQSSKPELLH